MASKAEVLKVLSTSVYFFKSFSRPLGNHLFPFFFLKGHCWTFISPLSSFAPRTLDSFVLPTSVLVSVSVSVSAFGQKLLFFWFGHKFSYFLKGFFGSRGKNEAVASQLICFSYRFMEDSTMLPSGTIAYFFAEVSFKESSCWCNMR